MKHQTSKAGKALAIMLAATMVLSINMPTIAWGGDDPTPDSPDPEALDQQNGEGGAQNAEGDENAEGQEGNGGEVGDGAPAAPTGDANALPPSNDPDPANAIDTRSVDDVDGTAAARIGDTTYATLAEAIAAVLEGARTTVALMSDLVFSTADIVTIPAGKDVVLDMGGHSITVTEDFSGRPLVNEGSLTLGGNGTIDATASASGGMGAVNNEGTLVIENGAYRGATYASGSAVRNTGSDAVLVIEGGTFDTATCAVFNEGTATIEGGAFSGTTCSACNSIWSYTIRNYSVDSRMVINGGTFTGVQGAVSASIGYLEVNGGTFKSVACATHGTSATFYALYAAGEVGKVKCVINGGRFETEGHVTAAQVGNDNTGGDGGINEKATVEINGGTFVAPEGVPAFKGAAKTGDPVICGGSFSSEVSEQYLAPGYAATLQNGMYTAGVADGMVAKVGNAAYATVQEAIDAATGEGAVVTLITNATESVTVPGDKSIVLELNGKTLTGKVTNGKMENVVTNNGTLVIRDASGTNAGTIMGGTDTGEGSSGNGAGIALKNNGTCMLESGTIMRGDDGTFGGYTIESINAELTIAGGVVKNNSNASSMIRMNTTSDRRATLTITGGTIEQDSFIAIKNDEGDLLVTGGTISSSAQAVQNWNIAKLFGGTFNGKVCTWRWNYKYDCQTTIADGAIINGEVRAINYTNGSNGGGKVENAPRVVIEGGTIAGEVAKYTGAGNDDLVKDDPSSDLSSIVASGGTFGNAVPQQFCAPGYTSVALPDDAGYAVVPLSAENAAAEVDGAYYASIADAFANAKDGDTVTLLADAQDTSGIEIADGRSLTLDLNGHNVGFVLKNHFTVRHGALHVTGNGKLYEQDRYLAPVVVYGATDSSAQDYSVVTLGENVTLEGWSGLMIEATGTSAFGVVVDVDGTLSSKFDADSFCGHALYINGTANQTEGNVPRITVGSTAKLSAETSSIETGNGVYAAGYAEWTFEEGCTVEAGNALSIKSGTFDIQGGTYHSTGPFADPATANNNGSEDTGAAVSITSNSVYAHKTSVSVSGGTFEGDHGYALYEGIAAKDGTPAISESYATLSITGGTFSGAKEGSIALTTAKDKQVVTGGTFNSAIDTAYYDTDIYSQVAHESEKDAGKIVPRTYAITYELNGGAFSPQQAAPETFTYFDTVTLVEPTKTGYDFAGWTADGMAEPTKNVVIAEHSTGDRAYTAVWSPKTDTKYKVQHWYQNVEGDEYTMDEAVDEETGATDAKTAATARSTAGFTAKQIEQQDIAPDGTTAVKVYYDRNVHEVGYQFRGNVPSGASALPATSSFRYGAPVDVATAATAPGYTFAGWDSDDELTMGDADIVLYGTFTANGDTAFKVEHYQQKLEGGYDLAATDNLTGETDTVATAAPKQFAGFTCNEEAAGTAASGTIAGDGSLVLKLYYDRNSYEVSYAYTGDVPADAPAAPQAASYRYGQSVNVAAAPTLVGYEFSGWSRSGSFDMPAEAVAITGSWKPLVARIAFEANGGSAAAAIEGLEGRPVEADLPAPTRDGYAFAGWYDNRNLTGEPLSALPATFPAGTTTYYAKWNAVPLPDANVEIQVEVPQASADGSVVATVPDEAVAAAAQHAENALAAIGEGGVPQGMSEADAQAVADAMAKAESPEDVVVVVSLKVEAKDDEAVEDAERDAIEGETAEGEAVSLYLELSVEMTVKVKTDDGTIENMVPLGEVEEPLVFEIKVDPDLLQNKSVRIAHVHEDVTEIIEPLSVDRENGIVRFEAQKFSTYALLTSETCEVTFQANGGSQVDVQQVAFGDVAQKPADPARDGYAFAGWFSDAELTSAYDFSTPVESSLTLYAKWTKNAVEPGGDEPGGDKPGGDEPGGDKPGSDVNGNGGQGGSGNGNGTGTGAQAGGAKDSASKGSSLVSTGDPVGASFAFVGFLAIAAVAGAMAAWSLRRKRTNR